MEEVDPVTATIISAIIGSATAIGTTAFNASNQPSAPKVDPTEVSKQAVAGETANREQATKQAAQFLPGLQYNTSGGLSPDAYQQFSSDFSGNANLSNSPQMQQLVAKFLGLDTGASFGGDSSFGSGSSNPISPGLTGG